MKSFKNFNIINTVIFILYSTMNIGCSKFVTVDSPRTEITASGIFMNEEMASGAMSGLYAQLLVSESFASGGTSSVTYLCGLSSDELTAAVANNPFEHNSLISTNSTVNLLWSGLYKTVYIANSILEGLKSSTSISSVLKERYEGEAKFVRAFANFYLMNIFGEVPLVKSTDYRVNSFLPKSSIDEIYEQIISDLKQAEHLLGEDYSSSKNERVRPNKWVAKSLLARVYLFAGDWLNAEVEATAVINYKSLYDTVAPENVFLKNSKESIFQLSRDDGNARDAGFFLLPPSANGPSYSTIRQSLAFLIRDVNSGRPFWIDSLVKSTTTYYYPKKYKTSVSAPISEYTMVLRLAEQYLIRAEARINQPGKLVDGIEDLNIIRIRANLKPIPTFIPIEEALTAIEKERQVELFTEWGHRWLDLKRWPSKISPGDNSLSRADDILSMVKVGWRKEWKLYPIPQTQILNDPNMADAQNPGYD